MRSEIMWLLSGCLEVLGPSSVELIVLSEYLSVGRIFVKGMSCHAMEIVVYTNLTNMRM